jgi:hypothetical protein
MLPALIFFYQLSSLPLFSKLFCVTPIGYPFRFYTSILGFYLNIGVFFNLPHLEAASEQSGGVTQVKPVKKYSIQQRTDSLPQMPNSMAQPIRYTH